MRGMTGKGETQHSVQDALRTSHAAGNVTPLIRVRERASGALDMGKSCLHWRDRRCLATGCHWSTLVIENLEDVGAMPLILAALIIIFNMPVFTFISF